MTDLAFDVGQTQTRARLITADGHTDEINLAGFTYGSDLLEVFYLRCIEAAHHFRVTRISAVAGGMTGLYGVAPNVDHLALRLSATLGVTRVLVADDALTSHLGALGGEPGALIAAGTGIVGLGIGPKGAARVDGMGSLIGDSGSGWWVSRLGAIAAISATDGRFGGSPRLLELLEAKYGPVAEYPFRVSQAPSPVGFVASFASDIADAAREGDSVALSIWAQAGEHIGNAVVAAAARTGFKRHAHFPWAVTGRLTGAADLFDPTLTRIVTDHFPHAFRVSPTGSSLDGAERLLQYPSNTETFAPLIGVNTKGEYIHD